MEAKCGVSQQALRKGSLIQESLVPMVINQFAHWGSNRDSVTMTKC